MEDLTNDLDGYSFNDNLSIIIDTMEFDEKKTADLFVNQLLRAINKVSISEQHEQQKHYDELAVSMFKLWNIWFNPDDESIQQIARIFYLITPQVELY